MKTITTHLFIFFGLFIASSAWSGMQIEIADPLYFEQQHDVIFPWADAKLVTFEFEAAEGIQGGKRRAKELHDQFLRKIQGLPGGAILTFLTPDGQRIENYRFTAKQAAEQQKAQMSLWGRIFPDKSGDSLINVRLGLVEPPNGIQTAYESRIKLSRGEQPISGVVRDEITQRRIDFLTVKESNIAALADFLSGLAFYYKGAKTDNARSIQLLQTAIEQMGHYIKKTSDQVDYSATSAAHVYIARAYYHLAHIDGAKRKEHLINAEQHGIKAIALNPYEPDPYTVLAIIRITLSHAPEEIATLLKKAVTLAPGSLTVSYNLALINSGTGQLQDAIQRLEQVEYLQQQEPKPTYRELDKLQEKLRTIGLER
jgi:tetratricopeptide (TPR) repeat protein